MKLKIGKRTISFNNPFKKHKELMLKSPRKSISKKIKETKWDWENWTSTEGFPVSDNLMDWIIGQDQAMRECKLCLDEWMHKLEYLKKQKWWKSWEKPENIKPIAKELPSGPFLLLLGDAGTGKSLLGRALAFHLDYLYKKNKVKLCDVVTWKNDVIPSEPKISVHPTPEGKELVYFKNKREIKKTFWQRWGMKLLRIFLVGFGAILIGISLLIIATYPYGFLNGIIITSPLILGGASLFFFAMMIGYFGRFGGNLQGIGGALSSNAPKLLIDNSNKKAPFIDACLLPETMMLLNPRFSTLYNEGDKTFGLYGQTQDIIKVDRKQWEGQIISIKPRLLPEVKVTENHPVLIYRPIGTHFKIDEAKRLLSKDFKWMKAKDLRSGDILKICIPTPKSQFIEIQEDLAWLYGIYIAEGYCKKEGFNWNSKKHGEHWARELGFTFGFHERKLAEKTKELFKRYFNYDLKEDLHNSQEIQLICYSAKLCRQFKSMFGDSAKTKKVFHNIFYTSELAKRSFLKGFEDGDKDTTVSKQLFYDLITLHLLLGEIPSTYIRMTKGGIIKGRQLKSSLQYTVRMYGSSYKHYFKISDNEILLPIRKVCQMPYKGEIINPETEDGIIPLPFITHNTGHGSAQLYGSIAWDPYQTGGLGTPEHQRVTAGDVHRSHLGILYIDEIKNLTGAEAITLLTVLEDGQLPIALRSLFHGGDTSAMAVSTEPIPCMNFFIAAGNFDSINQIHLALMDRIVGYGKVVRMNNEMPNTEENKRKYVQFISQEIKRFNLLPFDKEACETIIDEGRRRSGYNDKLTVKLRPMISIIKTASVLAMNEGLNIVSKKHINEAIQEHCKSIQKQLLEYFVGRGRPFIYLDVNKEPTIGQIAGLSVSTFADEEVGEVALLKASIVKMKRKVNQEIGSFEVSGAAKPEKAEWITDSIKKVRHVIHSRFGIDLRFGYDTMIDFQQEYGVDGPSAGITMTLALVSVLLNKKIRQDVAVTGEITVDQTGKIIITPIGGTDAKIKAAEYWGYKKVVIPKRNYEHSIISSDYKIKVVGCESLEEYIKEVFVDE